MKIAADFHHSGAARGQVLVLHHRLGHDLYFPSIDFVEKTASLCGEGTFLPCLPGWLLGLGGVPDSILDENGEWKWTCGYDEFMSTEWDAILITRCETQQVFRKLLESHPHKDKMKFIAMTGNDGAEFEWDWIKNFMSSDEAAFRKAPADINKIWYSQEIGTHYGMTYTPIDESSLHTVNQFVNCWPTFTAPWSWESEYSIYRGQCPHCDSEIPVRREPVIPYEIWTKTREMLPDYTFGEYGIGCELGCVPEVQLPVEYAKGALTFHMKTYDGYGYSMLQSIACGRPVIVPRRFHRYRTAGKYLIPNLTCFEAEWNAESVVEIIRYVTENVRRADEYGRACYKAAQGLFNWELEAMRIGEFLEELR